MANGARYKVQTRYGWFSLDEGSYRDYLAGKLLWIDWPPKRDPAQEMKQEPLPPEVSQRALRLRDNAARQGLLKTLGEFARVPQPPCKERMRELAIYELSLSVRANNGLMRGGVQTFGKLDELIHARKKRENFLPFEKVGCMIKTYEHGDRCRRQSEGGGCLAAIDKITAVL